MRPDYTGIVPLLLFLAWIASGVYMMVTHVRLLRYVREFHSDRWRYLTTFPLLGPYYYPNGFRTWPYIFNDQDCDDPKIVVLKAAVKRSLIFVACAFGAMLLMALTVVVFVVFFQK